jgi:Helicase HerA, central domain
MKEILEKLIAVICLTLIGVLIIGAAASIPTFHAIMGGFWQFVGQLWLDIQVVCAGALALAATGVVLYFKREYSVIRPGKYGEAQAIVRKGMVIALPSANIVEAQGTAEQLKQLEQYLKFTKNLIATAKSFDAYYGDEGEYEEEIAEGEEEPKQLARPRDEYLIISDDHQPHADIVLAGRGLIVGVSGSGKSNAVATLCEELGRLRVPMILADTENEYQSLGDPRWLPNGTLASRASGVTVESAANFGRYVLEHRLQVILNLHSYEFDEAAEVMVALIGGLREWEEDRANECRIPCEFLLEEATTWLPQNVNESPLHGTELFNKLQGAFFNDMVRKGRKRGLGLAVICQKIAEIDKRALQSDWKLLLKQTEINDLKRYSQMGIGNEETLSLQKGEGYLFTSEISRLRIQVRRRHSEHGANTPGLKNLQSGRNSFEMQQASNESWRNGFEEPAEPFENISKFVEMPRKTVGKEVPDRTKNAILGLYREGTKRTDIQGVLGLNGDEYWMVKAVCDDYDKGRKR